MYGADRERAGAVSVVNRLVVMKPLFLFAPLVLLCACQPAPDEAPPSAPPVTPVEIPLPAGVEPADPVPAFVGIWSAEEAWCLNPDGERRPVQLTESRFTGYENTCEITQVTPTDVGWTATFTCIAEGEITTQPVAIEANDQTLEINWIEDSGGQSVEWRRCPA